MMERMRLGLMLTNLLTPTPPRMDNEIYADFRSTFPDLKVEILDEASDFKNEAMKAKWRAFIMK